MKSRLKFAAWLAALYGGVLASGAAALLMLKEGLSDAAIVFVAALALAVCAVLTAWLHRRFVIAPHALAERTRVVLANPAYRAEADSPELAALATEINRLAGAYHGVHTDMEAKIAESGARLEEERHRLAALMSDLSQAVLLCNAEGRVLLYNEQARALFSGAAAPLGLGRSVFGLLDRGEIAHALDRKSTRLNSSHQL